MHPVQTSGSHTCPDSPGRKSQLCKLRERYYTMLLVR